MGDDALRAVVLEVITEALRAEQGPSPPRDDRLAATTGQPRGIAPEQAGGHPIDDSRQSALAARVGAWTGRPRLVLPGPAATWRPVRDRQGYLAATPARLGVGRVGTRYRTPTVLEFRADHAAARDAVRSELEPELVEQLRLLAVSSAARDKTEFLRRPDLGRRLSEDAATLLSRDGTRRPQIQIVVGDGLSATAIRVNLPRLLPLLLRRFEEAHLKIGRPVYVKNARVAVADQVGRLLEAELLVMLVGERPGLKSAESVGAYITYFAGRKLVEAQRSVVSNIHDRGLPPEEGARRIGDLCLRALEVRGTGIDLGVR